MTEWSRSLQMKSLVFGSLSIMLVCGASTSLAQDIARLDQIVQSYVDENHFAGAVLVAQGDKVLLNKGYGEANREWAIPNGPDTKFRIASVTKSFTAAAILVLAERGKLKVDDKLTVYFPEAPAAWKDVTVLHLLTHTSGIPDFTNFPNFSDIQATPTTAANTIASFRDKPLEFTPGSRYKYSSSGYVLLGYLIEKISGQSYGRFLQEAFFTPLDMKDSGYDSNATVMARRATGYTMGKTGVENAEYTDMSLPFAAGGLYSTTQDLLRWQRALHGGKVLSPPFLRRMTTPYKDDAAAGLYVINKSGVQEFSHDGHIQGFRSFVGRYPASNVDVIILNNIDGRAAFPLLQDRLARVAAGGTVVLNSERKEIPVAVSTLRRYEGAYRLMGEKYSLQVRGDKLWAGGDGKWRWQQLKAESDISFFYGALKDVTVEVIRDESGNATSIVMHNGGRSFPGPRWVD